MIPHILFDVGANYGEDSVPITATNTQYQAYAFEPTPELVDYLTRMTRDFSDRYHIIPCAVSDFDGSAQFHLTAHANWGCSSLLTFSDGLDKTWPDRTDFFTERSIDVKVIRLDGWLKDNPQIEWIDFFHCDTQGTDLKVLQGMGDYFGIIRAGCIEVPQSKDVMLYKGQHTKEEALDFLNDKGYEVFETKSQQNEDNIYFRPIR